MLLREGLKDSKFTNLVWHNNPQSKGSTTLKNCKATFVLKHKAHKMTLVTAFLSKSLLHSDQDTADCFNRWLDSFQGLHNNLVNSKVSVEHFHVAQFLDKLPKTTEWQTFVHTTINEMDGTTSFDDVLTKTRNNQYTMKSVSAYSQSVFVTPVAMNVQEKPCE